MHPWPEELKPVKRMVDLAGRMTILENQDVFTRFHHCLNSVHSEMKNGSGS